MWTWELETVKFNPVIGRTKVTASSSEQAIAVLDIPCDDGCFVRVSLSEGNVSWGEFELWCAGNRAVARILEHRERDAPRSGSGVIRIETVTFRDGDGSLFTVTFAETVPRELAVETVRAWLCDQQYPSMLVWS